MRRINAVLRRIHANLVATNIAAAALAGSMAQGTTAQAAAASQMKTLNGVMSQYQGVAGSTVSSNAAMTSSFAQLTGWLHKTSIGLYVMGGSLTSVARVGMGASLALGMFEKSVDENSEAMDRMNARIATFNSLMSGLYTRVKALLTFNLAKHMKYLNGILATTAATLVSIVGYLTILTGAFLAAWAGLAQLGKGWADVEWHLQKAINASQLAKDSMDDLTQSLFEVNRALGVFSVTDTAEMFEKLAYAGVNLNQNIEEAAESVGMLAFIAEKDLGDITRDLSRLREQMSTTFVNVADTILGTFAQASISYEDTIETFQQAGLILQENLGVTRHEVGAMAISLAQFGYTGGRAATSIRALAAEASQLKSGLEGSDVIGMLGIEDAYKRFQEGKIGIVEFTQAAGEAGAKFGHFTSLFRKRAAVVANAIASSRKEWDTWVERVKQGSGEAIEQFDKLSRTIRGWQKRSEIARKRLAARASEAFAPSAKSWNKFLTNIWKGLEKFIMFLQASFKNVPIVFQQTWLLMQGTFFNILDSMSDAFESWINDTIISKFNHVMGFFSQASQFFGQGRLWPEEGIEVEFGGFEEKIEEINERLQESAEQYRENVQEVMEEASTEDIKEKFQEVTEVVDEQFKESLLESTDALNELELALSGPGLIKIVDKAAEGFQKMYMESSTFGREMAKWQSQMSNFLGGVIPQSQLTNFKAKTTEFMNAMVGPIQGFMQLTKAQNYFQNTIEKVEDSMSELYGTQRYINRRHGAIRRDTGEVIGRVRGGEAGQQGMPEMIEKRLGFLREFAKQFKANIKESVSKGQMPTRGLINDVIIDTLNELGYSTEAAEATPEARNTRELKRKAQPIVDASEELSSQVSKISETVGELEDAVESVDENTQILDESISTIGSSVPSKLHIDTSPLTEDINNLNENTQILDRSVSQFEESTSDFSLTNDLDTINDATSDLSSTFDNFSIDWNPFTTHVDEFQQSAFSISTELSDFSITSDVNTIESSLQSLGYDLDNFSFDFDWDPLTENIHTLQESVSNLTDSTGDLYQSTLTLGTSVSDFELDPSNILDINLSLTETGNMEKGEGFSSGNTNLDITRTGEDGSIDISDPDSPSGGTQLSIDSLNINIDGKNDADEETARKIRREIEKIMEGRIGILHGQREEHLEKRDL